MLVINLILYQCHWLLLIKINKELGKVEDIMISLLKMLDKNRINKV